MNTDNLQVPPKVSMLLGSLAAVIFAVGLIKLFMALGPALYGPPGLSITQLQAAATIAGPVASSTAPTPEQCP